MSTVSASDDDKKSSNMEPENSDDETFAQTRDSAGNLQQSASPSLDFSNNSHDGSTQFFKNISIPVPGDLPRGSTQIIPMSAPGISTESLMMPTDEAEHTLILMPNDAPPSQNSDSLQDPSSQHTVDIKSQDLAIKESKSRFAVSFLLKKSKHFCGAIRLYLSKPATVNTNKIKSFMTSLKDYVKSTLASNIPSSQSISQITSSLVSNIKERKLPACLRFLGFSLTSISKRKKIKGLESKLVLPMLTNSSQNEVSKTFLNAIMRQNSPTKGGFQFLKPKVYECEYCETKFYKMPVYLKHIRRHAEIIACKFCGKAFSSVINQRRHQLQCKKRKVRACLQP